MSTTLKETRHGKRAEGKTQTSISLANDVLEKVRREAKSEGRSVSNYLERLLVEKFSAS